jgi:hypothetical protein
MSGSLSGEYERRDAEFDRLRVDTLRAPERFADTIASDEETLGYSKAASSYARIPRIGCPSTSASRKSRPPKR